MLFIVSSYNLNSAVVCTSYKFDSFIRSRHSCSIGNDGVFLHSREVMISCAMSGGTH